MNEEQREEAATRESKSTSEVVTKVPTFISKPEGKLYLIQHPLKPADACSKELLKFSEVKYKAPYEKFQFNVPLDPKSAFYDKDKGETLGAKAAMAAGADPEDVLDERPTFDQLTLEGSPLPKPTGSSRYVIAVIKKDQIHLCPLQEIVQVKPTFEYLNKTEPRKGTGDSADEEDEKEEEEATKVTVKFARNRDPTAKDDPLRPKSYAAIMKEVQETPWKSLEYEEFSPSNLKLVETPVGATDTDFSPLESRVYMEMLFPKYREITYEVASEKKVSPSTRTPISHLKQMSLGDQVKTLMTNGIVLRYQEIQEFLRVKLKVVVDDSELIRTLQTAANVIQGNWVVRSDLVYPPSYVSSSHGISREIMQEARDLILSKYVKTRVLERKKMCNLTKLPVEEITEILQPVARKVPREGWEFKLPEDAEFIAQFPDVIIRQNKIWERKTEQKFRRLSGTSVDSSRQHVAGASGQRRRSRTKSVSSDADSGTEDRRGARQRRASGRSETSFIAHHNEP